MEETKEGFLEKSNQGTMKGEESLTGPWGEGSLHRDEERLGHSEMAHSAETEPGGSSKKAIGMVDRDQVWKGHPEELGFLLRLCKQQCDTGTCSFRPAPLQAGWGKGLKVRGKSCPSLRGESMGGWTEVTAMGLERQSQRDQTQVKQPGQGLVLDWM